MHSLSVTNKLLKYEFFIKVAEERLQKAQESTDQEHVLDITEWGKLDIWAELGEEAGPE